MDKPERKIGVKENETRARFCVYENRRKYASFHNVEGRAGSSVVESGLTLTRPYNRTLLLSLSLSLSLSLFCLQTNGLKSYNCLDRVNERLLH